MSSEPLTRDQFQSKYWTHFWTCISMNTFNFVFGQSLFIYESFPLSRHTLDIRLVVSYFSNFLLLLLLETLIFFSASVNLSQKGLKICVILNVFITMFTAFYLYFPVFSELQTFDESAFKFYPYSLYFQSVASTIFFVNSTFATWFLWKLSRIEPEADQKGPDFELSEGVYQGKTFIRGQRKLKMK